MLKSFTIDQIMGDIENWLTTGNLNSEILSENFQFISPFWECSNKNQFTTKFLNSSEYQEKSLSKILKFDPIIKLKDDKGASFSIVLQYHTKNQHSVYEAVLGKVANGLLIELRSIYDLMETKAALGL